MGIASWKVMTLHSVIGWRKPNNELEHNIYDDEYPIEKGEIKPTILPAFQTTLYKRGEEVFFEEIPKAKIDHTLHRGD